MAKTILPICCSGGHWNKIAMIAFAHCIVVAACNDGHSHISSSIAQSREEGWLVFEYKVVDYPIGKLPRIQEAWLEKRTVYKGWKKVWDRGLYELVVRFDRAYPDSYNFFDDYGGLIIRNGERGFDAKSEGCMALLLKPPLPKDSLYIYQVTDYSDSASVLDSFLIVQR